MRVFTPLRLSLLTSFFLTSLALPAGNPTDFDSLVAKNRPDQNWDKLDKKTDLLNSFLDFGRKAKFPLIPGYSPPASPTSTLFARLSTPSDPPLDKWSIFYQIKYEFLRSYLLKSKGDLWEVEPIIESETSPTPYAIEIDDKKWVSKMRTIKIRPLNIGDYLLPNKYTLNRIEDFDIKKRVSAMWEEAA